MGEYTVAVRENSRMSLNPEEPAVRDDSAVADTAAAAVSAEERATVTADSVRVQRSPRYSRFMLAGAIVFAVIAAVLTFAFPENPTYDRAAVFGFLLAVCATIGVTLGAVLALLLDRRATRRAKTAAADRIDVRIPEEASPSTQPVAGEGPPAVES